MWTGDGRFVKYTDSESYTSEIQDSALLPGSKPGVRSAALSRACLPNSQLVEFAHPSAGLVLARCARVQLKVVSSAVILVENTHPYRPGSALG